MSVRQVIKPARRFGTTIASSSSARGWRGIANVLSAATGIGTATVSPTMRSALPSMSVSGSLGSSLKRSDAFVARSHRRSNTSIPGLSCGRTWRRDRASRSPRQEAERAHPVGFAGTIAPRPNDRRRGRWQSPTRRSRNNEEASACRNKASLVYSGRWGKAEFCECLAQPREATLLTT